MVRKEMNIYLITFKEVDYDQYEGFVVQALSSDRILDVIYNYAPSTRESNVLITNIREVKLIGFNHNKKEKVILESFNAG